MAKIPRIELGDRPSAVYNPTVDASAAAMMGSVADATGEALATATAEELTERKRLAEALEAKQRIVDSSNAGRVSLEFEDTHFKTLAQLETDYASTPEKIPAAYTDIMREQAEAIRKREDINDTVKLMAVKDAESTMSSGLRAAYASSSRLQTEQVKGNLAKARLVFAGAAIGLPSPEAVENISNKFKAQQMANFVAAYGKDAEEQMQKSVSEAYYAWAKDFTHNHPGEFVAMNRKLLKDNIPQHYTELEENARSSMKGIYRRKLNDTYVDAVRRGSTTTKAYSAGVLTIPDILSDRAEWGAQIDAINADMNLTPEEKTAQIAPITRELEVLKITEDMMRTEIKADFLPDDELPAEITEQRNALFGTGKKFKIKAKSLDELLEYKKNLVLAHSKKNISPDSFKTLIKEVDLSMEKTVSKERNNTWAWFTDSPKQIGNAHLEKRFDEEKPTATAQERNRATLKFIEMYNAAAENGKAPTAVEAAKLAEDAFNIAYNAVPKEGKR